MAIQIIGDIDDDAFKAFDEALSAAEAGSSSEETIDVTLTSSGGEALVALAFYDRIRNSPNHIRITGLGKVLSAAVLILAAGHTRRLGRNAWVMVHDDTTPITEDLRVVHARKHLDQSDAFELQWCTLLSDCSTTNSSIWMELHEEETYLTAEQCLEMGLIEEIV